MPSVELRLQAAAPGSQEEEEEEGQSLPGGSKLPGVSGAAPPFPLPATTSAGLPKEGSDVDKSFPKWAFLSSQRWCFSKLGAGCPWRGSSEGSRHGLIAGTGRNPFPASSFSGLSKGLGGQGSDPTGQSRGFLHRARGQALGTAAAPAGQRPPARRLRSAARCESLNNSC